MLKQLFEIGPRFQLMAPFTVELRDKQSHEIGRRSLSRVNLRKLILIRLQLWLVVLYKTCLRFDRGSAPTTLGQIERHIILYYYYVIVQSPKLNRASLYTRNILVNCEMSNARRR